MAIELLQELFGEEGAALTYEQLDQAAADKGLKLADLSTGEYVGKGKYDELQGKLTTAEADLTTARGQLEGYDPDWQEKVNQAATDAETRVAAAQKSMAIRYALDKAGTVDPEVVQMLIQADSITLEDGKLTGMEEQLEQLRKSRPYLFSGNGGKPRFGASLDGQRQTGDAAQDRVNARYANNPWYNH